ncbi:MAG: ribonuclease III [bacterium]|nr:ribonuclease III [bacterium]
MSKDILSLEKKFGIEFRDKDLLQQAFVHRSYLNENPEFKLSNNERLEFLGDAVLELVTTRELFLKYPDKTEGELTSWRAALVNSRMLSQVAQELGLDDYLLLSRGETRETGKARNYILANTVEAFIGALYLDQGLEAADTFLKAHILSKLDYVLSHKLFEDAKSRFQEAAQAEAAITPVYKVISESGPDHAKRFLIGAYLGEDLAGEGEGDSKQEAEEQAAKHALQNKGWE